MNEKENKNRRDLYLKIRVSREELDAIDRKFRNSGMKSRSEFVRAMIFEGYIVQFNEEKLSEILRLARNISGNAYQSNKHYCKQQSDSSFHTKYSFQNPVMLLF